MESFVTKVDGTTSLVFVSSGRNCGIKDRHERVGSESGKFRERLDD